MGKSKIRTLLTACVMIMLCAAMIVGGTYALWSDNVAVENHLSAGTLKVSLYRTYYEKYTLGDDMYMKTEPSQEIEDDFSTPTTASIFGLNDGELIVPTSWYAARLKLTNDGNVAIDYTVKIKIRKNSDKDLAKQIKVFIGTGAINDVTYDEGRFLVSDGDNFVEDLTYDVFNGVMDETAKESEFWVKIEFIGDEEINNAAQGQNVYFDLLVDATQKTTKS